MANLTRASQELFRRSPDECFPSLAVLSQHCLWQKEQAIELWQPPRAIGVLPNSSGTLMLAGKLVNAGDRTEIDQRAARLLALAA